MLKKLFFFLLIILFIYCSDKQQSGKDFINKKILCEKVNTNEQDTFKIFFTKEKEIKLECTNKSIITDIEQVYFSTHYIIIKDKTSPLPMIFDTNGTFLYEISHKGRGPNEINNNTYMNVIGDTVIIKDQKSLKLFSISKNQPLKTIDLIKHGLLYYNSFLLNKNKLYLFSITMNYQKAFAIEYDINKDSLKILLPMYKTHFQLYEANKIYYTIIPFMNKDKLFLTLSHIYKIYNWSENKYKGYYTNDYFQYKFLKATPDSPLDEIFTPVNDYIRKIFLLKDRYLVVYFDYLSGKSSFMKVKIDGREVNVRTGGSTSCIDIYDLKTKKIFSNIKKTPFLIKGIYKDGIIDIQKSIVREQKLSNPTLILYKLNENALLSKENNTKE